MPQKILEITKQYHNLKTCKEECTLKDILRNRQLYMS